MITITATDAAGNSTVFNLEVPVERPKKVWSLQQTPLTATVKKKIAESMTHSEVTGFSVRFPWKDYTPALLEDAYNQRAGKEFSIRFMAGKHTPDAVASEGPYYMVDGVKCPTPFYPDGSPNVVFEAAYADFAETLAGWCDAHGVALLHLPWYGEQWAELNHGLAVRSAPGYSYKNWLNAHKRLIDIGHAVQARHPDLAVEWPLSGHGPLAEKATPASKDLALHMVATFGQDSPKFYAQANGWGPNGEWGAQTFETEDKFSIAVWPVKFKRAVQAIQPTTTWTLTEKTQMFDHAVEAQAEYVELYTPSLTGDSGKEFNELLKTHSWNN